MERVPRFLGALFRGSGSWLLRRLRALCRRDAIADEIREEYEFHLDMRIEERMRQGWSRREAERMVRRKFGNISKLRDEGYDVRGGGVMETIWQDVRHSVRMMRRKPAYAAATIATLALGMGLIAALSSIVDAAWLRPLPFVQADRLGDVMLHMHPSGDDEFSSNPSVEDVAAMQSLSSVFAAVGSYHSFEERPVFDDGEPERVRALTATDGYFEALGAVPVIGRAFTADDGKAGAEPVVVLGFGFWRQRFGADPDVIGRRVTVDGVRATVVGVAPQDFHRTTHVWRPMPAHDNTARMRGTGATVVVQLREGVAWEDARQALDTAARQWVPTPHFGRVTGVTLEPVYREMVRSTRDAVRLVATAVLVLVVLVGVNVSSLVYADGVSRRSELAVRAALGAGRWRLVRQQLTDATVLALAACGLGLLMAAVALDGLLSVLPLELPPHAAPAIDVRTIAVTLACGVVAAWVIAAWPAWRLAGFNLREWIEGRIPDIHPGWFGRPGQVSVFVQVALAVVLLASGGLLLRSLDRLLRVDLGFEPEAVQVLEVAPLDPSPVVWSQYYPALVERLQSVPGVERVGASDWVPLRPSQSFLAAPEGGPELNHAGVTPGVLEALGVRLTAGRLLAASDAGLPVTVLSEAAAREVFGRVDVVGEAVSIVRPHTVVGVVSDIKGWGPRSEPQNVAYTWLRPQSFMPPSVVLRTSGGGPTMAELRTAAASIGPRVIVERMRPVTALLSENVEAPRERTVLLLLLAACGLVLALVGVGGVTAQAVARRTREIGVRVAFGARPGQVVRTVASDTLKPALFGLLLGLGAAYFTGRFVEQYLFQVTPTDPVTMAVVGGVVVVAATVVAWIPARHAARVDPVMALRQ